MKTLEKIIPYLPYKLKGRTQKREVELIGIDYTNQLPLKWKGVNSGFEGIAVLAKDKYSPGFTPILHPLSDLTKEQLIKLGGYLTDNNQHDILKHEDAKAWLQGGMRPVMNLKQCIDTVQYLYSIHADIHGLIEQGLAIDINTLEK